MAKNKSSTKKKSRRGISSPKTKGILNIKSIKILLLVGFVIVSLIFCYSYYTSKSDTFGSKLSDAFSMTFRVLGLTSDDYFEKGIVSNDLGLETIQYGYPQITEKYNEIEIYSGFHLSYNEKHEQANWVSYILTKNMVRNDKVERTNNFRSDMNIKTESASLDDYKSSGYDRGHLAPAADMHWSDLSMRESFLMSNISPQEEEFNRGVWRKLEEQVRDFAVENENIFVVTGPLLKKVKKIIGDNNVSVPIYYFKVILDISPPNYKGVAFLLENKESEADLKTFAMSIDELESFSGIDFFYQIKNSTLDKIEATYTEDDWNF